MNTDGSECCDIKEQKKQQQQQQQQNAFYVETKTCDEIIIINQHQQQSDEEASASACGTGGGGYVQDDVAMEMAPNYTNEWNTNAAAGGTMRRRVSFPKDNKNLVTGYMEPADPWANGELCRV